MDIWEANSMSAAYTPHPCNTTGLLKCSGDDCGNGSDNRFVSQHPSYQDLSFNHQDSCQQYTYALLTYITDMRAFAIRTDVTSTLIVKETKTFTETEKLSTLANLSL